MYKISSSIENFFWWNLSPGFLHDKCSTILTIETDTEFLFLTDTTELLIPIFLPTHNIEILIRIPNLIYVSRETAFLLIQENFEKLLNEHH